MIPKGSFLFFCLFISLFGICQTPIPHRVVPLEMASIRYEDSYIKLTYSRPDMDGRNIFGEVVPFGKIWTPGSNETTEIMLSRDIMINEDTLFAGAYAIFIIPNKDYWQLIFNTDVGRWGTYRYNEKFNVLEVEVPVTIQASLTETLTIEFNNKGKRESSLQITWEHTQISIPILFMKPIIK